MARVTLSFEWGGEMGARRIVAALQDRAKEHGVLLELVSLSGAGEQPDTEAMDKATAVWEEDQ